MKWFISQSMSGRTNEEIQSERTKVIEAILIEDINVKIADSYIEGVVGAEKPIWYLGEAIKNLADVDICIFVRDCLDHSKGCRVECLVCTEYGIQIGEYDTETGTMVYH